MDEQGVDVQALSINGFWWYAADREQAARIVQAQTEGLAHWVASVTVDLVLDASFLSDAEKEAILGGTLRRLLRIGQGGDRLPQRP